MSDAFVKDYLLPLVGKIKERVERGEISEKYLRIAKYMTDPKAPFPIPDAELPAFFESMRQDGLRASLKLDHN